MLEDAIIFCGNCPPSTVWLEKVMLTGTTTDTISRSIKKDAAVKYPIRRNVSAFAGFTSKYCRGKLFKSCRRKLKNHFYYGDVIVR